MSTTHTPLQPEHACLLEPLGELSPENLKLVCAKSRVSPMGGNDKLQAGDEHRWLTYVLQGRVIVRDGSGELQQVEGGRGTGQKPLFDPGQLRAQAVANGSALIVRVEREQLELLLRQQQNAATQVHDVQVTRADNAVFDAILEAFHDNRLRVPALPEVALRVRRAVESDNSDISSIARIIQNDPVLSARVIRVANSPVYRRGEAVNSLSLAIGRLGLGTTRKLAIALAVKQLFSGKFLLGQQRLERVYEDATRIAALCYLLAENLPGVDPETAMLAGLLHDIGAVPIIAYAEESAELFDSVEVLEATIHNLSGMVGNWVLAAWDFDDGITDLPLGVRDWSHDAGASLDLVDVVNAALLHDAASQGISLPQKPSLGFTPVGRKLREAGMEVTDQLVLGEASSERLDDVRNMLSD